MVEPFCDCIILECEMAIKCKLSQLLLIDLFIFTETVEGQILETKCCQFAFYRCFMYIIRAFRNVPGSVSDEQRAEIFRRLTTWPCYARAAHGPQRAILRSRICHRCCRVGVYYRN